MTAALAFFSHVAVPFGGRSPALGSAVQNRTIAGASASYSDYLRASMERAFFDAIFASRTIAPDPSAVLHAREFLSRLPIETPVPSVVVEEDGAVAFDWETAPRSSFTVSVAGDGRLRYGGLFGHDTFYGTLRPSGSLPRHLLTFIARTHGGS